MTSLLLALIVAAISLAGLFNWLRGIQRAGLPLTLTSRDTLLLIAFLGTLVGISLGLVFLATRLDLDRDGVVNVGIGGIFTLLVLARPLFLWADPRTLWFRRLLTDRGALALYFAIGVGLVGRGTLRLHLIARATTICQSL